MMIEVTAEHIEKGIRFKSRFCPVSLALQDATGLGPEDISVGSTHAQIRIGKGHIMHFSLPCVAETWIFNWDWSGRAEPFSFVS